MQIAPKDGVQHDQPAQAKAVPKVRDVGLNPVVSQSDLTDTDLKPKKEAARQSRRLQKLEPECDSGELFTTGDLVKLFTFTEEEKVVLNIVSCTTLYLFSALTPVLFHSEIPGGAVDAQGPGVYRFQRGPRGFEAGE